MNYYKSNRGKVHASRDDGKTLCGSMVAKMTPCEKPTLDGVQYFLVMCWHCHAKQETNP